MKVNTPIISKRAMAFTLAQMEADMKATGKPDVWMGKALTKQRMGTGTRVAGSEAPDTDLELAST